MLLLNRIMKRAIPVLHILFIIIWLNNLSHTDAYFSVYALIAFTSFYFCVENHSSYSTNKYNTLVVVLSLVFSLVTLLGNYSLFTLVRDPARIGSSTNLMVNLINSVLSFIGGFAVGYPILSWWFRREPRVTSSEPLFTKYKHLSVFVFLFITGINLIHLFLVEYPGNLTEDTFTQISEMISGNYSNFNTFWHTILFEGVLSVGYFLFGNINAAAACFSVFQIVVMAFAFTYCLVTMDRSGVHKVWICVSLLIFAFIPYHMALTISIWKDVLFAGGCLLIVSSLLRILKGYSKHVLFDYFVFFFGSLLFILSRTNGWIIYLVMFLLYLVFNHKNKKLLLCMGSFAAAGWMLLNPVLSLLNVPDGDLVESLSVPVQQVSRVIVDGCEISETDTALLSRVVDLEEVPDLYVDWLSDPMKVELRSKDYDYFLDNFDEYRNLWIRLGVKYPWEYIKAWVDQTKGYWNGGYGYAMYSETVADNPYGVAKSVGSNPIASVFRLYFGLSRHVVFFEPLHSIGLHVWIVILCFLLNIVRKREEWIISVPILILVIGLWFGTPVYACFRYVYPLFVCFPLIFSTAFSVPSNQET